MRTVSITKALTAASTNCIALQQTVAGAGNVVLNGGSVTGGAFTLDTQRRIAIASDGNDSAITATIYGNRASGQLVVEVLALTNAGTAVSVFDYLTGGTIALSGAAANHITIGTNGTGSTDWIMPNYHLTPFNVNIVNQVTGSVTWNLETTQDNTWYVPAVPANKPNVTAVVSGSSIAQETTLSAAVTGYRYTITAGTGTLAAQSTQSGISNY
jgi:hypothetical protein